MKPFFAISALLCLLSVQACKKDLPEQPPVKTPVLEITTGDIVADPSGEECTLVYTITEEVEGGTVTAQSPAEWVEAVDYDTVGSVSFTVLPNHTESERTSKLIVTYNYGEGLAVKDSINITQPAAAVIEPEYDYEFEMKELYGVYYGTKYGLNGEYSYFITLSDLPYGADGYSQPGGTYYILDMFGPAPEDGGFMCPVGTYTLGEPGATAEFTFTPDISFAATISEDGESRTMNVTFTEGTIDVSKDDSGNYVIEATLVDNNGDRHHITYTGGEGTWKDDSAPEQPAYGTVDRDLNMGAITAATSEFVVASGDKNVMTILFSFTDMPADAEGNVTPPGSILTLEAFMPYDANGYIAQEEYEVVEGANFYLIVPGRIDDVFGMPAPSGAYVEYVDETGYPYYGAITAGTMKVSGPGYGWYTIEWDFTTAEGYSVTGSWTGNLPTEMPSEFSTLDSDYTLDLSNIEASATYYGDWYVNGGGDWQITLYPPIGTTGGDGLIIDLNAEKLGYDAGIPAGTYTAGAEDFPEPAYPEVGEYRRGFLSYAGKPQGTCYVGDLDGMRNPSEMAPATDGDLIISYNDDGTYTLEFSFLDDMGHTWDGEWTGYITLSKYPFADAAMKDFTGDNRIEKSDNKGFKVVTDFAVETEKFKARRII